jgi:hypothetical protein
MAVEEFRSWKGHRYIFLTGYEKDHRFNGENTLSAKPVLVGMAIRGPVSGPEEVSKGVTDEVTCEMQLFQLSPEHRVYGFQKGCVTLDPALSVSFGSDGIDNHNWESETLPKGRTRLSFMEDVNECVFEHAYSFTQEAHMRWVHFGKRAMGMQRIHVTAWEVWGFESPEPGK